MFYNFEFYMLKAVQQWFFSLTFHINRHLIPLIFFVNNDQENYIANSFVGYKMKSCN